MSFESPDLAPAPTRRSNRHATVATPLTRREARAAAARRDARREVEGSQTDVYSVLAVGEEPIAAPTRQTQPDEVLPEDAFAEAARIFLDAKVVGTADAAPDNPPTVEAIPAPEPVRRRPLRAVVAAGSTAAVMGVTALLAVSMTLPSEAVAAAQGHHAFSSLATPQGLAGESTAVEEDEIQAFVASDDIATEPIDRAGEQYSMVSLAEVAAQQGINYSNTLYTNDPDAAIQWPFVVGVSMSSPYGPRRGAMHEGIDLVPGNGAPIQVIADGVVRVASEAGGAYGVHVWVDHVIDGQSVSSHYAHMQYGSLRVRPGQHVKVGDILGKTGNTGRSYGAHLHFEIAVNGTKVDPLPWMQENAGRYEY